MSHQLNFAFEDEGPALRMPEVDLPEEALVAPPKRCTHCGQPARELTYYGRLCWRCREDIFQSAAACERYERHDEHFPSAPLPAEFDDWSEARQQDYIWRRGEFVRPAPEPWLRLWPTYGSIYATPDTWTLQYHDGTELWDLETVYSYDKHLLDERLALLRAEHPREWAIVEQFISHARATRDRVALPHPAETAESTHPA